MGCREDLAQVAASRGWERVESSDRTGSLGALDEWHRDGKFVRAFFGPRGGIRTAWIREGNRDWFRIEGQQKREKVIRYLKTEILS